MAVLGLHRSLGFSPVVAGWGYSPIEVCRLLLAVTSLVVEQGLGHAGFSIAAPGL